MINCSNCGNEIMQNYCPNCGQKYVGKRISFKIIIEDFWDSLFSMDKSFWVIIKMMITNPNVVVLNYWNGFRNYYFPPFKFLLATSLILGLNLILFKNTFLGLKISAENFSSQLGFVIILIPFLTISSYAAYFKFKKNLVEHLVMNVYNLSIWILVFSVISICVSYFKLDFLKYPALTLFLTVIFIWDSLVFEINKYQRIMYIFICIFIFSLMIGCIIYLLIQNKVT